MDYQNKKFSIPVGGDAYRDGWDRIFGKQPEDELTEEEREEETPQEKRCRAFVTVDMVRRVGQCLLEEGHTGGHFPEKPPADPVK